MKCGREAGLPWMSARGSPKGSPFRPAEVDTSSFEVGYLNYLHVVRIEMNQSLLEKHDGPAFETGK